MTRHKTPLIFVLAGEQSGDMIGGKLLAAIKDITKDNVKFIGVGGQNMAEQGLDSIFPMSDLSVMGLFEVIKHLPVIYSRFKEVKQAITDYKPDIVITIDAPDFSLRLSKHIKSLNIPHIHYIAPTVWAWRPGRAKSIAKKIDHLLAVYPFEPKYFEVHNLPCTFVGHMISELNIDGIARTQFREKHDIAKSTKLICWLPGSRMSEVELLVPIHKQALIDLQQHYPDMVVALPVAPSVADYVKSQIIDLPFKVITVEDTQERYAAMRAANVALAASGTVNLELSMAQTPFVITYKINPLTAWLAKLILKDQYVTMVNILCDGPVIPELLQEDCTPDNISSVINHLFINKSSVENQLEGQRTANIMLRHISHKPSYAAAKIVLSYLEKAKNIK